MNATRPIPSPFGDSPLERRINRALDEEERRLARAIRDRRGLELSDHTEQDFGDFASSSQHTADVATETYDREVDFGLVEDFRTRLEEVTAAKQRLAGGNYGRCQRCGSVVDADRLTALPATPWCRTCAGRLERQGGWLDAFCGDRRGVLVSTEFLPADDAGLDTDGGASQEEAAVTVLRLD